MHKMRRHDRELTKSDAFSLLEKSEYGVLATVSDDGSPYAVALNYVFAHGHIYFHCAPEGLKLENIRARPRVSFCVVAECEVLPVAVSTAYKSVNVFGRASLVDGLEEKHGVLQHLMQKYTPMNEADAAAYATRRLHEPTVVRIEIDSVTAKSRPNSDPKLSAK